MGESRRERGQIVMTALLKETLSSINDRHGPMIISAGGHIGDAVDYPGL